MQMYKPDEHSRHFIAHIDAVTDAKTGKTLWVFKATEPWKACPMTYVMNGRQYVAIASGGNILSFALQDTAASTF